MSAIVRKRIETTYKITTDETLYSMTTREEFTPVAGTVTEYFLATDDGGQRKRLDVSLDNGRHGEDDDGWLMTSYIGRSPEFLPDIAQELIFQHYQAVDYDA